jgi:energy-coupling factor transport system ATP-binding protein
LPGPLVTLENVSYSYPRSRAWALKNISLEIAEGEFLAVMGENGAGKTSFCKLFNGVIPHSQGGTLRGTVTVDGIVTADSTVAVLAGRVGMALDDPETQLFAATVRGEVAFGPENLLMPPAEIGERAALALEITGLSAYAGVSPAALSGGQKQRLVIAAALALANRALVLDEPTSQLDPAGAAEVLSLIGQIREQRRLTVIMATHNSEEAAAFADRVCVLNNGRIAACDTPRAVFGSRELLRDNWIRPPGERLSFFPALPRKAETGTAAIKIEGLFFSYAAADRGPDSDRGESVTALEDINLSIADNDMAAIVGRNGGGKTTLLKNITGLLRPSRGDIYIRGRGARDMSVSAISAEIGFVMQNPDRQLFAGTVYAEAAYALRNAGLPEKEIRPRVEAALDAVGLADERESFPLALSRGDRAKAVIASVLAMGSKIIILDEPAAGQDYRNSRRIMDILLDLHQRSYTIIFVTHNMPLAAEYSRRVIVMKDKRITMDGPTAEIFSRMEESGNMPPP